MQKLRLTETRGTDERRADRGLRHSRKGAILVWFALIFVVMLGMMGLVIDAGLLMAAQRQAQNAADAAALAAAHDLMLGRSAGNGEHNGEHLRDELQWPRKRQYGGEQPTGLWTL